MSALVNLIPRNGELVNILPPAAQATPTLAADEMLVAIHHVSPSDEDIYIIYQPATQTRSSRLVWCRKSATTGRTALCSASSATAYQITPIGNELSLVSDDAVEYYLWRNNGYTDLGDADFNIDLQFGIKSSEQPIEKELGGSSIDMEKSTTGGDVSGGELVYSVTASNDSVRWAHYNHNYFEVGDSYYIDSREYGPQAHHNLRIEFSGMFTEGSSTGVRKIVGINAENGQSKVFITVPPIPAGCSGNWSTMSMCWVYWSDDRITGEHPYQYIKVFKVDSTVVDSGTSSYILNSGGDVIIGLANEFIESANKDNKFVMPFFVRYALKLKTGQIINLSAPCYIEPNTLYAPEIFLREKSTQLTHVFTQPIARAYQSTLYYRVVLGPSSLDVWKDVVESVVVAITPPIYLYDQSVSEETLKSKAKILDKDAYVYFSGADSWGESKNRSLTIDGALTPSNDYSCYFMLLPTGGTLTTSNSLKVDTAIRDRQRAALATWYIVKEIPIGAITTSDEWVRLDLDAGVLSAIYAQDTGDVNLLADTAVSYYKFMGANGSFAYNNRLFYFGGSEKRFGGWNPLRMSGWVGSWPSTEHSPSFRINFSDGTFVYEYFDTRNVTLSNSRIRFWAYPSASAISVEYPYQNGTYTKYLQPQGTVELAFAFYYDTASRTSTGGTPIGVESYPNKLYMSYQNQPLVLDRNASITFSGTIRAMSVVTQALSQGQFGQFPLYVFTSDGIWMLEISSTGAISFSHPVSRDVLTQGTQPLQTDDAVFFITAQGLKRIVGSKVDLVSEVMHGAATNAYRFAMPEVAPTVDDFPHRVAATLYNGVRETQLSPIVTDFLTSIQTARMLYDYTQRLIHVYMGTQGHYVYDLDGGEWAEQRFVEAQWGAISGNIDYFLAIPNPVSIVHQYPYSVMQINRTYSNSTDAGLYVYDGSTRGNGVTEFGGEFPRFASALTRPIALTSPTEMKALMDFRLIGQKADAVGQARSAPFHRVLVYASRDGVRWHRLNSLKKSSYKYFRFLIYSFMADADTLTGLTLHYQVRRTNKLR